MSELATTEDAILSAVAIVQAIRDGADDDARFLVTELDQSDTIMTMIALNIVAGRVINQVQYDPRIDMPSQFIHKAPEGVTAEAMNRALLLFQKIFNRRHHRARNKEIYKFLHTLDQPGALLAWATCIASLDKHIDAVIGESVLKAVRQQAVNITLGIPDEREGASFSFTEFFSNPYIVAALVVGGIFVLGGLKAVLIAGAALLGIAVILLLVSNYQMLLHLVQRDAYDEED